MEMIFSDSSILRTTPTSSHNNNTVTNSETIDIQTKYNRHSYNFAPEMKI